MRIGRGAAALAFAVGLFMTGCADKTITLSYTPPSAARELRPKLAVLPFSDARGNEGDRGDPLRVGGIYGGYGNRLAKIMVRHPWASQLTDALVAEFRATGVDATAAARPQAGPDGMAWLEGDVRNFSTEARWGREAHVGAIVRLRAPDGQQLAEKKIEVRESGYGLNNFDDRLLEQLLTRAFAGFARAVATDSDIAGALNRLRASRPGPTALRSGASTLPLALCSLEDYLVP